MFIMEGKNTIQKKVQTCKHCNLQTCKPATYMFQQGDLDWVKWDGRGKLYRNDNTWTFSHRLCTFFGTICEKLKYSKASAQEYTLDRYRFFLPFHLFKKISPWLRFRIQFCVSPPMGVREMKDMSHTCYIGCGSLDGMLQMKGRCDIWHAFSFRGMHAIKMQWPLTTSGVNMTWQGV